MSSVLHPVGPEEPQTYWVRRAIVIGAAILALIVVIAIIVSQTSSGTVVAQPTPSPVIPSPFVTSTPTPTPAVSATPTTRPSASSSSKSSPGTSKASAKPSASPTKKAGPVSCPAADLRATLTGKQRLKPKQANTFAISLINGSGATCNLSITSENFELKVYSGRDRIWSTDDCAKSIKTVSKKLAKEQAMEWKLTWDGRRSRAECQERPEIPKAGTYFATAQFKGAKPVQLRMILRG